MMVSSSTIRICDISTLSTVWRRLTGHRNCVGMTSLRSASACSFRKLNSASLAVCTRGARPLGESRAVTFSGGCALSCLFRLRFSSLLRPSHVTACYGQISVIASSTYSLRCLGKPGQGDPETGAALGFRIGGAVDIDLSIMLFHDGIDQRKAQTGPFAGVFGGVERLEQPVLDKLGNTAAFVLDDQINRLLGHFAVDADDAARLGGVAGVGEQIDQHLGKTLGIAFGQMLRVAEVEVLHFGGFAIEREQANGILGDRGEGYRIQAVLAPASMGKAHQGLDDA